MSEEAIEQAEATQAEPEADIQQEEVQEVAQEAEAAPEPEKPDFSRQFAVIAKKERELRRREEHVKELETRIGDLEKGNSQLGSLRELARDNPAKILQELGISYDDLTQQVINEGNPTAEQELKSENTVLRERLEKLESVYKERQEVEENQRMETAQKQLVDNIQKFVNDSDGYDLVQSKGAYDLVAELMRQHYIQTKEIMEYSRAAQVVEDYYESEGESYFGSKKMQDKWRAQLEPKAEEVEEATSEQAEQSTKTRPKTLSNEHAVQQTENSTGLLSREQSLERIARMLDGSV